MVRSPLAYARRVHSARCGSMPTKAPDALALVRCAQGARPIRAAASPQGFQQEGPGLSAPLPSSVAQQAQ